MSDAVGTVLGRDLVFGHGVRAAGGGTGIGTGGRVRHDADPAPRHPNPAACSRPPVIRDRVADGRRPSASRLRAREALPV